MAKWYYFDASGNKIGPVDSEGLKRLAGIGAIMPETLIETISEIEASRAGIAVRPGSCSATNDSADGMAGFTQRKSGLIVPN